MSRLNCIFPETYSSLTSMDKPIITSGRFHYRNLALIIVILMNCLHPENLMDIRFESCKVRIEGLEVKYLN